MNVARPGDRDPRRTRCHGWRPGPGGTRTGFTACSCGVSPGDDALLELAGLRFAQMGVAAELYADTPDEAGADPPVRPSSSIPSDGPPERVGINVLSEQDRSRVAEFADRFAGRAAGLVVHDKSEMVAQTDHVVEVMRELEARLRERPGRPKVFLEYAAGSEPEWFIELAERLLDAEQISCCIDIGHVGMRQASARFNRCHPGLSLGALSPEDGRLPDLAADVQDAVDGARRDVIDVVRSIGSLGKHVHFHLHDGHPLIPVSRITSPS